MKAVRLTIGMGALVLTMCVGTVLFAQAPAQGGGAPAQGRGGPPAPPQNLQILPKDISRADMLATMRGFTAGLGVQCNYCHVQEGRGGRNDMASDEKQPKKTARVMMQMMAHVNETLAAGIGKPAADITQVECATCHRGEAIPKNPPPPPPPAAPGGQAPGL
jgi:Photosynthetic reaction centre cytochrome C subunit